MPRLFPCALSFTAAVAVAAPVDGSYNTLENPRGMADRLLFWDSVDGWRSGEMNRVGLVLGEPPHLVLLDRRPRAFPRDGTWTSPVIETEFPITEALPSWNVDTPEGTGLSFEVRVRGEAGDWSPWLSIGNWGDVTRSPRRVIAFGGGEINVDTLVLSRPAGAIQIRAVFQSTNLDAAANPSLRRMTLTYSGRISDEAQLQALMPPPDLSGRPWARVLDVPQEGQGQLGRPLSAMCCSPTSVTMVLESLDASRGLNANAMAIYDPDYEIFGNWNRAVAYAGTLGLDAWLERFRTWDQVKAKIADGQPVIASVRIRRGDLDGVTYTGGHLVVVRGFTPNGDPIINDPALGGDRGRAVVHRADQFARVWFGHGGVGYIIQRPAGENTAAE